MEELLSVVIDKTTYFSKSEGLKSWHEKLDHQNIRHCTLLKNYGVIFSENEFKKCQSEICIFRKQHREHFSKSTSVTKECGEMEEKSIGGCRIFLLLKNDYSTIVMYIS